MLRKPWTIAATCHDEFQKHLARLCDGSHTHSPTAGVDTRKTEGYTEQMVDAIHAAWGERVSRA